MTVLDDPVRGTSEPGRVWCVTNVSEATPDLLSPLCWSIWGPGAEQAWLATMHGMGLISRRETKPATDPNQLTTASIYGRQAMNVDVLRSHIARFPGVSPDDFERDLLGGVRPGLPAEPTAPRRIPIIAGKMPLAFLRAHARLARAAAEIESWWRTEVFEGEGSAAPYERLMAARDVFERAMSLHVMVRMQYQAIQSAVTDAAARAGRPALAADATSGQGGVKEVTLADDLWLLSRGGLEEREFLSRHGYHGPNEGNVYTRSWREEPERVRALARSMASRPDLVRATASEATSKQAGEQAQEVLLARTSATRRPALRFMLARARNVVADVEIGKAAFLMGLDGCRAAARDLGRDLVAAGRLHEVDDVFFLTIQELGEVASDGLSEALELVAFRRAAREEYRSVVLPPVFTGMPLMTPADPGPSDDVRVVRGAASGGGRATGRARVVLDPNEDVDLDEGDVLVCRFTDPSWAPLFTLATALVIDLGGAASHGALVARELGLPYVIGTGNGTSVIREGDEVLVDGVQNVVRVLTRAT